MTSKNLVRPGRGVHPRRLRAVAVLTLGAALAVLGAPAAAAGPTPAAPGESAIGSPRIRFENRVLDLGEVLRGQKAEGRFVIRNTGDRTLHIEKVQPGCGCTLASFDASIPPGGEGYVHVTLDTTKQPRNTGRHVTVYSDDPVEPIAQLKISAKVLGSVLLKPSDRVQVGNRRPELMFPKLLVRRDPTEEGVLEVSDLRPSASWLEVTARRVESPEPATDFTPAAEPGDWIVEVRPGKGFPYTRTKETVRFATGLAREPEREFTVYVALDPPVELSTKQVELEPPADGRAARETVLVRLRHGVDPGALRVEVDPPELEVELENLGRLQFHAHVRWTGGERQVGSVYFVVGDERVRMPVVRRGAAATASIGGSGS